MARVHTGWRRWTDLGDLFRRDEAAGVAKLRAMLEETGGNIRRAAFLAGIDRVWIWKLLHRYGLMAEVEEMRRRRRRPAWLVESRRRLRMDDVLQQIAEACAGMTEDEVLDLLSSSSVAGEIEDPGMVAAYVVHLAGGAA